jgi:hypothetical protein
MHDAVQDAWVAARVLVAMAPPAHAEGPVPGLVRASVPRPERFLWNTCAKADDSPVSQDKLEDTPRVAAGLFRNKYLSTSNVNNSYENILE